jgi:copper oxidase (laccase) domain-containing protein
MQKEFNTHTEGLYVGLGPAIRSCCYEVGKEFINLFSYGLMERDGSYYLDLVGINKKQALSLGVKEENIFDSGICTSCRNEDFFSFRKEGKSCGRIMSVIMLI